MPQPDKKSWANINEQNAVLSQQLKKIPDLNSTDTNYFPEPSAYRSSSARDHLRLLHRDPGLRLFRIRRFRAGSKK